MHRFRTAVVAVGRPLLVQSFTIEAGERPQHVLTPLLHEVSGCGELYWLRAVANYLAHALITVGPRTGSVMPITMAVFPKQK